MMKKFLLQIFLLSVFDLGTLLVLTSAPGLYISLWVLVWLIFRIRGKDLFLEGLLFSSLAYNMGGEPEISLPALALWYIPIVIFLFYIRKKEKEKFTPLLCLAVPLWMGFACVVTACAGWTTDCLYDGNAILGVMVLFLTICRTVFAGVMNLIRGDKI